MNQLVVDLHVHSHYSRATSPASNIENLYRWAKLKGIDVLGTGDITHPKWIFELQEKLTPDGAFLVCVACKVLRPWLTMKIDAQSPQNIVRF